MVVVVVADQHRVDGREHVQGEAGLARPFGTEQERPGALGPDRVGEDVHPGGLDERGGVAHIGDAQLVGVNALGRVVLAGVRDVDGPGRGARGELPAEQVRDVPIFGGPGRMELLAVEVVGYWVGAGASYA